MASFDVYGKLKGTSPMVTAKDSLTSIGGIQKGQDYKQSTGKDDILTKPRSPLQTPRCENSPMQSKIITLYRHEIFTCRKKSNTSKGALSKAEGKKSQVTVNVPREVLASRSPGSKPRMLLAEYDAKDSRKRRKKCRSPGAPPPVSRTRTKQKTAECTQQKSTLTPSISPPTARSKTSLREPGGVRPKPPSSTNTPASCTAMSTKTPVVTGLIVDPKKAEFTVRGGHSCHLLMNESNVRLAIKVRSSNNEYFRVNPVYSFLDAGTMNELEVIRLPGGVARNDKLLVCYTVARDDDTDVKKLFTLRAKIQSAVITIRTYA